MLRAVGIYEGFHLHSSCRPDFNTVRGQYLNRPFHSGTESETETDNRPDLEEKCGQQRGKKRVESDRLFPLYPEE